MDSILRAMPKSQIVPVPGAALAEPVICISTPCKPVSKLSSALALARQDARRRVLDHVSKRQCRQPTPSSDLRKKPITISKPPPSLSTVPTIVSHVAAAAVSSPASSPMVSPKVLSPPSRRSPRVALSVVPEMPGLTWQCIMCTYEQEYVPGSRTCVMCHSTRRRSHCHRVVVQKTNLVVRTRLVRYSCPNCRLAERCKPCLVSRRQKCIDEIMQY